MSITDQGYFKKIVTHRDFFFFFENYQDVYVAATLAIIESFYPIFTAIPVHACTFYGGGLLPIFVFLFFSLIIFYYYYFFWIFFLNFDFFISIFFKLFFNLVQRSDCQAPALKNCYRIEIYPLYGHEHDE